jgi:hypothetical protein
LSFSSPGVFPDLDVSFLVPSTLRDVCKTGSKSIVLDVRERIILEIVSVGLPPWEWIESKVLSCGVRLLYTAFNARLAYCN